MTGNQHISRRRTLLNFLALARGALRDTTLRPEDRARSARFFLYVWEGVYLSAPASTRRRWKCGR